MLLSLSLLRCRLSATVQQNDLCIKSMKCGRERAREDAGDPEPYIERVRLIREGERKRGPAYCGLQCFQASVLSQPPTSTVCMLRLQSFPVLLSKTVVVFS